MKTNFGEAAGKLKLCGLRLYLYFLENNEKENIDAKEYAIWLGKDYNVEGRGIRKALHDGIEDLINNGFLEETKNKHYKFLK